MFEQLWGKIAPASAKGRTPLAQRVNQFASALFVAAPLAGVIYALVNLPSDLPSAKDLALLGGFYAATALGITIGFHRMGTHMSFQAPWPVRALLLILGTMSIQGAALSWIAIHTKHHVKSDTPEDPHSPTQGFWHAHVGWIFGTLRAEPEQYAKGQMHDPVLMFVSRTALWWAVLGMVLPFLIGGYSGFLWGSLVRVFLVHHVTWSVNSVCHVIGTRPFKTGKDLSTNNPVVGILAAGEGWHNNHHAFPRSAFHGLAWWQVDFSGYAIWTLQKLRLVRQVYRVSPEIIKARMKLLNAPTPAPAE